MGKGAHFPEAREIALTLAAKHPDWSAQRIVDELERRHPDVPFSQADDKARTVRSWLRPAPRQPASHTKRTDGDANGAARPKAKFQIRWSPIDPSHPSDPVLLEVLALQLEDPERERAYLTLEEAETMARLAKLMPDARPGDMAAIARAYLLWSWTAQPDEDLDTLLAFTPWRDEGRRYADAFRAGAVKTLLRLVDGSDDEIEQALADRWLDQPIGPSRQGAGRG
jgi:hypothetical protein